jgi:hypothetical protein
MIATLSLGAVVRANANGRDPQFLSTLPNLTPLLSLSCEPLRRFLQARPFVFKTIQALLLKTGGLGVCGYGGYEPGGS